MGGSVEKCFAVFRGWDRTAVCEDGGDGVMVASPCSFA
jgi:hypothetical protein